MALKDDRGQRWAWVAMAGFGFSLSDMGGPNMGYAAKLQFPWGYLQEKLLMYFVVIDV